MKSMGIVFSNIHDQSLPELTRRRTIASVPIAARYRMIDFVLSSLANSKVTEIGIITKTKYHSLMQHVGSGKDWDLDRKNGGITTIAPFVDAQSGPLYTNRLEAMINARSYIESSKADLVILADCDLLANVHYNEIIDEHLESGADVTAAYKKIKFVRKIDRNVQELEVDDEGKVTGVRHHNECTGSMNYGMNIYVMSRQMLVGILNEAQTYGFKSFSKDVLPRLLRTYSIHGYEFKGYIRSISVLDEYFKANMDVLDRDIRDEIFDNKDFPVFTHVLDSPPTQYGPKAQVKNSLIADGCYINGVVENSVLFRGVRVDEGASVKNCVILNDNIIENGASLDHVVTDKRVLVSRERRLSGCEGYPFFIGWGESL